MADYDFQPPSFSLGLDFDLHSEPQPTPPSDQSFRPRKRPSTVPTLRTIEEEDGDFESPARFSEPPRVFKRIRRGSTVRLTSEARKVEFEDWRCNVDDDIEGFSSEEDWPRAGSLPSSSVCSSSKPSLYGQRVVTSESGSQWKSRKGKEVSSASGSVNVEKNGSNDIFPQLTVSPLRRFQLIDSDSDDPSMIEDTGKEVPLVNLSPKNNHSDSHKHASSSNFTRKKESAAKCENEDLWRDFCSEKSSCIPTPAFDEICKEYFTNVKNKNKPDIVCKDSNNGTKQNDASLPSAHYYFFHNDSRIQKLVRDRLPYFFPLRAGDNQEYKQQNVSVIDYMGQFGHEDNSRKTNRTSTVEKKSTRSKGNVKKSKQVGSISQDSENWVNPRSGAGLKKNSSSRMVQATSQSSGHWYMGSDGRRVPSCGVLMLHSLVYVNKNGQEMTGQIAYRHYRKESGSGFKKTKKKAGAKKTAAKKPTSKKK